MSHIVTGLVQRKKVGSPTRKSVLMYMAGCASDDGTGVWSSKSNIAADLEMGKRTVQNCIDDLVSCGIISVVGNRPCRNGFTIEYRLNLDAIYSLESTRENENGAPTSPPDPCSTRTRAGRSPVQDVHLTRAGRAPHGVQDVHPNHPRTVNEPSDVLAPVIGEELAEAFIAHRKSIKKPMTEKAAELMAKKLRGFSDPRSAVEEAIMNGWQGVFHPKQNFQQQRGGKPKTIIHGNGGHELPFEVVK